MSVLLIRERKRCGSLSIAAAHGAIADAIAPFELWVNPYGKINHNVVPMKKRTETLISNEESKK